MLGSEQRSVNAFNLFFFFGFSRIRGFVSRAESDRYLLLYSVLPVQEAHLSDPLFGEQ